MVWVNACGCKYVAVAMGYFNNILQVFQIYRYTKQVTDPGGICPV
jgi:hypothetical protein